MSDKAEFTRQLQKNFESYQTEALLAIWRKHDQWEWTPEAFAAVRAVLEQRQVDLPPARKPASRRALENLSRQKHAQEDHSDFASLLAGLVFAVIVSVIVGGMWTNPNIGTGLIPLLFFVLLMGINYGLLWYSKQRVRKAAESKGWRVLNISTDIWSVYSGSRSRATKYKFKIIYLDQQGQTHHANCEVGVFSKIQIQEVKVKWN